MKTKTSDLSGPALDWAVAKCEGYATVEHTQLVQVWMERRNARGAMDHLPVSSLRYSTDWSQGGPIIDGEGISLVRCDNDWQGKHVPVWAAVIGDTHSLEERHGSQGDYFGDFYSVDGDAVRGPTPLIAAMRCYVASKLGDEVDVPEELLS